MKAKLSLFFLCAVLSILSFSTCFGQKTKTQLDAEADSIKNETIARNNNATRLTRMWKNQNASFFNITNGDILPKINGGTGTSTPALVAGTNITITGAWPNQTINQTGGSGITNSAANNELMRSNGTNAIASGLFVNSSANLSMGTGLSGAVRTLSAEGSASYVDLAFSTVAGGTNTEQWRIISTGLLRNSPATIVVPDASIGRVKSYYSTSDNSVFHLNAIFEAEQTAATTNSIQGLEGYAKVSHGSGTVVLAIGSIGNIELASVNPLTLARSMQAGGNITAAGSIGEWDGLYVNLANSGGGSVGTGYGIYVDNFPSGVTNKFNIYTADGTGVNKLSGKTVFTPQSVSFSSDQNNLAVGGTIVRMSTDDTITRQVTGISSGVDGEIKFIRNTNTTAVIAFNNEDSGSTASNRIHSSTGSTLNLNPGKVLILQYDGSISRYIDVSF